MSELIEQKVVVIDYTNHRGERRLRRVYPLDIVFQNSEWHPETQWLLLATDVDKVALREFAMSGVHSWRPEGDRQVAIDIALAKQLQRSMERNARMVNRLQKFVERWQDDYGAACTVDAIKAIAKDEEPAWRRE